MQNEDFRRGFFGMRSLAGVAIRPATAEDAASVAAIHTASWRDAYAHILAADFLDGEIEADRLSVWSQRLRERPASQLVDVACDLTGRPLAFVCCYCDFDPHWGSLIDNLHVLPQARGQGLGEQLLRAVVAQLTTRQAWGCICGYSKRMWPGCAFIGDSEAAWLRGIDLRYRLQVEKPSCGCTGRPSH